MLTIVVTIIILGVLLWGGNALLGLIPMDARLSKAIRIIVIVCVVLYLISMLFGVDVFPLAGRMRRWR